MKLAGFGIFTVLCILFALIPEMIMWKIYNLINPVDFWEKFFTFAVFWFGGASLCMLFAVIAVVTWGAVAKEL